MRRTLFAIPIAVLTLYSSGMTAVADTFAAPDIVAEWSDNSAHAVNITVCDNANCESGYRIYRSPGHSFAWSRLATIISAQPARHDTITWHDSTVIPNAFYSYRAVAWRGSDTVASMVSTVYTFQFAVRRGPAHFTRLANFPISLKSGWSALAGDSIILQESTAPAGLFTVIDVHRPSSPRREGLTDSAALTSYPLATLIPMYLKFHTVNNYGFAGGQGAFCMKNDVAVIVNSPDISLYKFGGNTFTRTGSYRDENIASVVPLDDSLLCVLSGNISAVDGSYSYLYPLQVSAAGGVSIGNLVETGSYRYGTRTASLSPNLRGTVNRTLLVAETFYDYPYNTWQYMTAYDLDSMQYLSSSNIGEASWRNYSGYRLSADQFLSLDAGHVYAEDPLDLNAFQTAVDNNAVLTDSFSGRQNVLVDTVKRRLYILYSSNLSVFSYEFPAGTAVRHTPDPYRKLPGVLRIRPSQAGVVVVFPGSARHADLVFYDLYGRIVDKITVIGRSSVFWQPKTPGKGCFSVSAKIDGEDYSARFLAR